TAYTEMNAVTPTKTVTMSATVRPNGSTSSISDLELDHLVDNPEAEAHGDQADAGHHHAALVGEEQARVLVVEEQQDAEHQERQGADDHGGRPGLGRHGLDLQLHLLALPEHVGQVLQRFRQ